MNRIPLMPSEQHARLQQRQAPAVAGLWNILDAVKDPEIPALSLWDLGVLRNIEVRSEPPASDGDSTVRVTITPTYSGCPAMDAIADDIRAALSEAGYPKVEIDTQLAPAWTTEWMSAEGREKLFNYGIAPPLTGDDDDLTPETGVVCPHCGSDQTRRISEFGSTACKALFQCGDCSEPFDYFKKI